MSNVKGFTLIELLIVIGILAILATTVVLVLQPGQLLAETRDTQRLSDIDTLRSAIGLYQATFNSPRMQQSAATAAASNCVDGTTKNFWATVGAVANPFATALTINAMTGTSAGGRAVDGTGWVPVKLSDVSGGSPVPQLPLDPSNSTTHYYAYACHYGNTQFKFAVNMESTKYAAGGPGDKEANSVDGGTNANFYEVGTSLTL